MYAETASACSLSSRLPVLLPRSQCGPVELLNYRTLLLSQHSIPADCAAALNTKGREIHHNQAGSAIPAAF